MSEANPFSTTDSDDQPEHAGEKPEIPGFKIISDKPLGEGGMGVVWQAEQELESGVKRIVALKVLKHWRGRSMDVERARKEAQTLASLQHPHIVTLYEFGWCEAKRGGYPYFAMPLINGLSLDKHVKCKKPDFEARVNLLKQVLSAMASAHRQSPAIVHRDIKPQNVIVGADPEQGATVLDFGIADLVEGDGQSNQPRGITLPYASPEQAEEWLYRGRPALGLVERTSLAADNTLVRSTGVGISRLGPPSDVYSLGVLAYQLFDSTFQRPYDEGDGSCWVKSRESALEMIRHRPFRMPTPSLAKRRLGRVIQKALKLKPEERYQNAGEFHDDVVKAMEGRVTSADGNSHWERTVSYLTVHRVPLIIALISILGGMATIGQTIRAVRAREDAVRLARANEQLASNERAARVQVEGLARSTDRAMDFLNQVIFSVDTYNAHDRTIDWDFVFRAAKDRLGEVRGDARAEAIVRRAMGRIASNWGRNTEGVEWLTKSAELWQEVAEGSRTLASEARDARAEEARTRNWLAWALASADKKEDAISAADLAYKVARAALGATHEDTLSYRFDWARMRLDNGDLIGGASEFIDALAEVSGTDTVVYVKSLLAEGRKVAELAQIDPVAAESRLMKFVAPMLDPSRPRLRGRTPWSLAQAGEIMTTKPIAVKLLLSALMSRYGIPLQEMPTDRELQATGRVAITASRSLAASVLPSDHLDVSKIQKVYEKVMSGSAKP